MKRRIWSPLSRGCFPHLPCHHGARSRGHSSSPALPTGIWTLPLRSGAAYWDLELAAPDLLSQSYPAQGSSKIVMDPLSMTMTEDSRLVPQPKRKAAAGDLPLGTEDGINALQEDMDAMSQRLQRKLEALAEEATAVG
eukprot:s2839_g17.t1